ncbi:MAG: 16S rRNA (guanine(527)-N(7))-methyltransferase RsmG [Ignavibacteriales bacterium]|nr:16S rRNA (guanine(527)-N(7))-methyltransferase RsmG [Ignavibacteriales bacterium]
MKPDIELVLTQNGLSFQTSQVQQLHRYVEMLLDWNKKINLISRKDEELVWTNHILLSMSFACMFEFPSGTSVLDMGTGGGLPGIPLSIVFPETQFLLVDSVRKKISAVGEMIQALGLNNASTVWGRAEDLSVTRGFAPFDSVIARSVSSITNITTWSFPLLRKDSCDTVQSPLTRNRPRLPSPAIISLKGGDVSAEIVETQKEHPRASIEVMDLSFPGSEYLLNQEKKFVIVREKPL